MYTADTLSRAPLADKANDNELEQDAEKFIEVGVVTLPVSERRLDQYHEAQDEDSLCSTVKAHCKEGWSVRTWHMMDAPAPLLSVLFSFGATSLPY